MSTDNVTTITPAEPEPGPEEKVTPVWRVLKREEVNDSRWWEIGVIEDTYPLAEDLGEAFGEGDYLIFERDSQYTHHAMRQFSVVAEKRFRERTDDDD